MDIFGWWLLAAMGLFAVTLIIGALIAVGREGAGGPARGSLERDEDEEQHRG